VVRGAVGGKFAIDPGGLGGCALGLIGALVVVVVVGDVLGVVVD
jgi:hypothetical protein